MIHNCPPTHALEMCNCVLPEPLLPLQFSTSFSRPALFFTQDLILLLICLNFQAMLLAIYWDMFPHSVYLKKQIVLIKTFSSTSYLAYQNALVTIHHNITNFGFGSKSFLLYCWRTLIVESTYLHCSLQIRQNSWILCYHLVVLELELRRKGQVNQGTSPFAMTCKLAMCRKMTILSSST